jgi:parallel beta-helix repeat protein
MGNVRAGRTLIGITAAALLLIPLETASAEAQEVACGKTVMDNVSLQEDLVDCPSGKNGLTIGADGITVDLNGHKIIGSSGSATGIDNSDGHSGLKIIGDGSISGFTDGIEIRDSSGVQVSGLTIQGNTGIGLRVSNGQGGRFSNLRVVGNRAGGAVFADGADHNKINAVLFIHNGADGLIVAGDANTVTGNWANANAGDGFVVEAGATSTQLSDNRANGNAGNGFSIESAGTRLKANVAQKNTKRGIDAVGGTSDAGKNQASGNGASPQCTGVTC